ncbi:hypothetical protein WICPIJ_001403 [Wickerhamomyces pijperi]|uniref:Uncharacterized protein n=1 Tax=Wickerhamomyces pijperi TaxID=599730 RepID=A0A9P8QAY6_WICPI|nr:hypothetical protein WICPIJ_001403 [Wickerhamomyces pijperi]
MFVSERISSNGYSVSYCKSCLKRVGSFCEMASERIDSPSGALYLNEEVRDPSSVRNASWSSSICCGQSVPSDTQLILRLVNIECLDVKNMRLHEGNSGSYDHKHQQTDQSICVYGYRSDPFCEFGHCLPQDAEFGFGGCGMFQQFEIVNSQ